MSGQMPEEREENEMNMMQKNEAARLAREERKEREYHAALCRVMKTLSMFIGGMALVLTVLAGVTRELTMFIVMAMVTLITVSYAVT